MIVAPVALIAVMSVAAKEIARKVLANFFINFSLFGIGRVTAFKARRRIPAIDKHFNLSRRNKQEGEYANRELKEGGGE
jgi:hypothetical protein